MKTTGPKTTKQHYRDALEKHTQEFLDRGGKIQKLPHNISSWDENDLQFMANQIRNKKD